MNFAGITNTILFYLNYIYYFLKNLVIAGSFWIKLCMPAPSSFVVALSHSKNLTYLLFSLRFSCVFHDFLTNNIYISTSIKLISFVE